MDKYRQGAMAVAIGMLSLSGAVHADDAIKRLLDLQLKKGIITQEEYDEFMAVTAAESSAAPQAEKKAEPAVQAEPEKKPEPRKVAETAKPASTLDSAAGKAPAGDGQGVPIINTENFKVEVFGTIDLSLGYTSHSLVQSGEMPTSIGPYISGGVRYPRTTPTGPGGSQVPYPASNMSSQTGLFNGALSTSSWGIRANREIGADGLKAFVVLDSAFNPATGQLTDQSHNEAINSRYPTTAYATSSLNGQIFSKEAVAGFSQDKWGKIGFGRNTNPIGDVLGSYSPLQKSGLFSIYGNGVYGAGGGISENGRIDNSIKYTNKIGKVNFGLLYGLGSNGGLKDGNKGYSGNLGFETGRFGVQLVYQQFKDVIKTSSDSTLSNVIDLTTYDQTAILLVAKYKWTDALHMQTGVGQARLRTASPDPNIPFISNLYGEDVAPGKSTAYVGQVQKIETAHLGFDYDLTEKLNAGVAYMWVGFPRFNSGPTLATHYLGGYIDAWGGLLTYRLYKGVTLYTGTIFSHYRGDAFESNNNFVYVHDIFTASTGFRFRF
ncbi:MAG: porin [Betaproteobacteria bacterium]